MVKKDPRMPTMAWVWAGQGRARKHDRTASERLVRRGDLFRVVDHEFFLIVTCFREAGGGVTFVGKIGILRRIGNPPAGGRSAIEGFLGAGGRQACRRLYCFS